MSIRSRVSAVGNVFWLHFRKNNSLKTRTFCINTNNNTSTNTKNVSMEGTEGGGMTTSEAYKQLQNLDFMTAAKILFTAPPKKRSLAVYLVAQYARADMKKMDEERKLKRKKTEEEEEAKEAEKASKGKVSDTEMLNIKNRLNTLEEVVKEIADETKKISRNNMIKETHVKKEPMGNSDLSIKQSAKTTDDSRVPVAAEERTGSEK